MIFFLKKPHFDDGIRLFFRSCHPSSGNRSGAANIELQRHLLRPSSRHPNWKVQCIFFLSIALSPQWNCRVRIWWHDRHIDRTMTPPHTRRRANISTVRLFKGMIVDLCWDLSPQQFSVCPVHYVLNWAACFTHLYASPGARGIANVHQFLGWRRYQLRFKGTFCTKRSISSAKPKFLT